MFRLQRNLQVFIRHVTLCLEICGHGRTFYSRRSSWEAVTQISETSCVVYMISGMKVRIWDRLLYC